MKGLDVVTLAMLLSVSTGWSYDEAFGQIARPALVGPPSSTISISQVPAAAVDRLASLEPAAAHALTHRWWEQIQADAASIPDPDVRAMELKRWPERVCSEYLSGIVAFAKRAKASGKLLYLWQSQ